MECMSGKNERMMNKFSTYVFFSINSACLRATFYSLHHLVISFAPMSNCSVHKTTARINSTRMINLISCCCQWVCVWFSFQMFTRCVCVCESFLFGSKRFFFLVYFCSFWCLCTLIQPISTERLFTLFNSMYYECVLFAVAVAVALCIRIVYVQTYVLQYFFSTLSLDSVQFIGSKFIVCQYGLAFKISPLFFVSFHREFAGSNRQVKNTHCYFLAVLRLSFLFIPFDEIYKLVAFFCHSFTSSFFFQKQKGFKSLQLASTNFFFFHTHTNSIDESAKRSIFMEIVLFFSAILIFLLKCFSLSFQIICALLLCVINKI